MNEILVYYLINAAIVIPIYYFVDKRFIPFLKISWTGELLLKGFAIALSLLFLDLVMGVPIVIISSYSTDNRSIIVFSSLQLFLLSSIFYLIRLRKLNRSHNRNAIQSENKKKAERKNS